MAKAKGKKAEVTREQLEALADEINEVLDLDPEIKYTKKTTDEALTAAIKKESECVYTTDFEDDPEFEDRIIFTEDAKETFELLGIEIKEPPEGEEEEEEDEPKEKPAPKAKGKGKGKKAEPEPEEDDEDDEEDEDEEPAPKAKGKGKSKPAPAKGKRKAAAVDDEDEEDDEEAPAPKGKGTAKGKAAAPEKAKGKAKTKAPAYTRSNALCDALRKGPANKEDIVALADKLYVKEGGESNTNVQESLFRYAMPSLIDLGVVELDSDKNYIIAD